MAKRTNVEPSGEEPKAEKDSVLIHSYVTKEQDAAISEYRWNNRIESKSEAVRKLIEKGLAAV